MRKTIDITKPPTQEQLDMLNKAAALPIPADAEYPEFSAEELKQALTSPLQEPEKQQDAAPLKKSSGKRSLLPPGFRSCTPWKMFLAFLGYILVFAIALTLEVKDASGALLWLNRLFCLGLLLTLIAATFNYRGMQRLIPLYQNRRPLIRILGVFLLDALIICIVFTLLVLLTALFTS